jgi:hypothetical protein
VYALSANAHNAIVAIAIHQVALAKNVSAQIAPNAAINFILRGKNFPH